jgi:hypothetical protein
MTFAGELQCHERAVPEENCPASVDAQVRQPAPEQEEDPQAEAPEDQFHPEWIRTQQDTQGQGVLHCRWIGGGDLRVVDILEPGEALAVGQRRLGAGRSQVWVEPIENQASLEEIAVDVIAERGRKEESEEMQGQGQAEGLGKARPIIATQNCQAEVEPGGAGDEMQTEAGEEGAASIADQELRGQTEEQEGLAGADQGLLVSPFLSLAWAASRFLTRSGF